jgi:hypothetical protein
MNLYLQNVTFGEKSWCDGDGAINEALNQVKMLKVVNYLLQLDVTQI